MRPTSAGPPDSTYCEFFVNVWHRYDPFAVLAAFRPTEWGSGYIPIGPLQHFRNANVHGFTHYLDHPLVHVPIINAALGPTADGTDPITESDQATVLLDYPDTPTMACDAQIAQIKQQALALTQAADLEETIIGIAEFLATARQAADACKPLFSKDMFA